MTRTITIAVLLTLLVSLAAAQTTYTAENTPFYCDATGHYVPTSIPSCRGLFYNNHTVEVLWTPYWYQLAGYPTIAQPVNIYKSYITEWTELTEPQACTIWYCSVPGNYAFNWTITDANGVVHTGSQSGAWTAKNVCGGKYCWWHPIITIDTVTVDD